MFIWPLAWIKRYALHQKWQTLPARDNADSSWQRAKQESAGRVAEPLHQEHTKLEHNLIMKKETVKII